jgi:DHA2 family multidrug resistance protein
MWEFSSITNDWGAHELLFPQAIRGMAQQFAIPPTVTLTLGSLAPARLKLASGLFNLMRNLGGAIGIAICTTILNDRTNLHFFRLAEHLNDTNAAMGNALQGLAANFGATGADALASQSYALKQLAGLAYREALTLTFSDTYVALMVCFAITTALVPLMRKVAPPKGPSADSH